MGILPRDAGGAATLQVEALRPDVPKAQSGVLGFSAAVRTLGSKNKNVYAKQVYFTVTVSRPSVH